MSMSPSTTWPGSDQAGDQPTPPKRAAQYVRMSTEHQQYSTENQADVIREYAERRGFEIVRTYADEGKSGLRVDGRERAQAADRRRRDRHSRLRGHPRLRRQPLGPLPGRRRERLLRVHLQARRYRGALLRRAVRERRQPGLDHRQGRQAGDGGRVQPRAVGQGVQGPVPADRARLPPGRARRVTGCAACSIDQHGRAEGRARHAASRRACRPIASSSCPARPRRRRSSARSTSCSSTRASSSARSPSILNARGIVDRPRPAVDPRHGPPGADQREVHRQQRLQPRLVQAEEEAGRQSARDVDPRRRRLRSHRRPRGLFYTAQGIIRERTGGSRDDELLGRLKAAGRTPRPPLRAS